MKKWLVIFGLLSTIVFSSLVFAQTWHTTNQATIAWTAVTALNNGDPLPVGDTVEYVVYLSNAVTDPGKANPVEVATTAEVQATLTLNAEGQFFVGLKAIRKLSDGTVVSESPVVWSDDPAVCLNNENFGIRYFLPPASVGGLHPVTG